MPQEEVFINQNFTAFCISSIVMKYGLCFPKVTTFKECIPKKLYPNTDFFVIKQDNIEDFVL